MRTSNLVLIATVFVLGLGSSTLEAQIVSGSYPTGITASFPVASSVNCGESVVPSVLVASSSPVTNQRPYGQWYPYVIARAEDRQWIRETPIELRPNRPMHFWGNSRRRMWR